MSFLLADITAECPADVGLAVRHPPSSRACVRVLSSRERTEGHVCVSPRVCICLFDWLTLLTSLIWTIKSWGCPQAWGIWWLILHLSASLPPAHNLDPTKEKLQMFWCFFFFRSFLCSASLLFYHTAWFWGRTARGSAEEAGCEGVKPGEGRERGVGGGYSALMGLLVSEHPCSCAN